MRLQPGPVKRVLAVVGLLVALSGCTRLGLPVVSTTALGHFYSVPVTITRNCSRDVTRALNDVLARLPRNSALTFPSSDLTANDSKGPTNEGGQTLTVTSVTAVIGGTTSPTTRWIWAVIWG